LTWLQSKNRKLKPALFGNISFKTLLHKTISSKFKNVEGDYVPQSSLFCFYTQTIADYHFIFNLANSHLTWLIAGLEQLFFVTVLSLIHIQPG